MERKESFAVDEYYHIYQRGHNKNQVFLSDKDYWRFLVLLYTANGSKVIHLSDYPSLEVPKMFSLDRGETLVDIGAYCLMPNHFHLLLKEKKEGGISKFMAKLNTSFSMYLNKKYGKTGSPLEKPFKAIGVDNDEYLKYLFAYIHLNPVKTYDPESWGCKKIVDSERAMEFLQSYRFSSYRTYVGLNSQQDKILNRNVFPEYFSIPDDFNSFIEDWAKFYNDNSTVKVTPFLLSR